MDVAAPKRFPWLAVALAVVGLVIGYTSVVLTQEEAFAASRSCPNTCKGDDCKKTCTGEDCAHDCPGCKKQEPTS
jgi:hypothetical protein